MADENEQKIDPAQAKALASVASIFLDMSIQVIAVQYALVEAGILNMDQVQKHVDRMNQSDLVLKLRDTYGPRSGVLDVLLQAYKGTIQ